MNREELNRILEDHEKWLNELDRVDDEGRANIHDASLREIDLHEVNLRYANLLAANLWHANLNGASLQGADLQYANLIGANLQFADLQDADMKDTNLKGANLRGADLSCADLREADLQGADLREAYCVGTIFANADLRGADLRGAILWNADTDGMETDAATKIDWPMACPETGSFIGWKKAGEYIVKLEIPEEAERSSATTSKCRANKAMVLEIQNMDGTKADVTEAKSSLGKTYKIGEMVYPDYWDYNRWNECSHGIHFFMMREGAVAW